MEAFFINVQILNTLHAFNVIVYITRPLTAKGNY